MQERIELIKKIMGDDTVFCFGAVTMEQTDMGWWSVYEMEPVLDGRSITKAHDALFDTLDEACIELMNRAESYTPGLDMDEALGEMVGLLENRI